MAGKNAHLFNGEKGTLSFFVTNSTRHPIPACRGEGADSSLIFSSETLRPSRQYSGAAVDDKQLGFCVANEVEA
jgi:hypothetical protein